MIPTYVPLLKALPSELEAAREIPTVDASRIHPLFDICRVPTFNQYRKAPKWFLNSTAPTAEFVERAVQKLAAAWTGRLAMIDAYFWAANATIENGEHVLAYAYRRLSEEGVMVIPVLGYERWDNIEYRAAMGSLECHEAPYWCLRLDVHAIDDAADPDAFRAQIDSILGELELNPASCAVLVDFGDMTNISVEQMLYGLQDVLNGIENYGFMFVATAGCSMPAMINLAVKEEDSVGNVLRREMRGWQAARRENPSFKLVYGDYGIRGPTSNEGIPNKHGNAKIRYTTSGSYYIARGCSVFNKPYGQQTQGLALKIVGSKYYAGPSFSWGDKIIHQASLGNRVGESHAKWIAYDTSHHIAYALAEVQEFERALAAKAIA